jgi:Mrp family chromosome partitioning ATPase
MAAVAAEAQRVLCVNAHASRALVHRALEQIELPCHGQSSGVSLRSDTPRQLSSTPSSETASATISSQPTLDGTRDLLQRLGRAFDLVIVDLPPLDAAGALEWAPLLDGTVLVVEAERVRWQMAARGVALLHQAGATVLGTVINKRRDHIPQWLYQRL